jgi:hypothetical protein
LLIFEEAAIARKNPELQDFATNAIGPGLMSSLGGYKRSQKFTEVSNEHDPVHLCVLLEIKQAQFEPIVIGKPFGRMRKDCST